MNKIYDNGKIVLGNVKNIREYLIDNAEEIWEIEKILKYLEKFSNETIVAINYDYGIGYSINYWDEKDIVKECE